MKFRLVVLIGIFFIAAISAPARAQTEPQSASTAAGHSDPAKMAAIHRLLEVMDVANIVSRNLPAAFQQSEAIRETLAGPGMVAGASSREAKRLQLFRDLILAKFQAVDFVELMTPIYDKLYTLDDINALIVFYESPTGKKTLQVEPQVSLEMKQAMTPTLLRIMKETQEQIKKEHPELDAANDPPPSGPGFGTIHGGVVGGVPTAAPPPPPPPASGQRPMRIAKGGDVAAATATNKVAPIYPELARQARVEGTVRLHVVIDTDGRVIETGFVSGPAMLVQSAIDSVKQWRFRQTILQGVPVEVECVIEINFRMAS